MIMTMTDYAASTVLSESNLALVEELRLVRESVKSLKAREDEIRQILLKELKDSDGGVSASGVPMVNIDRQSRTKIDGNRLQALHQDAWKDCLVESTVYVIRLPEAP